ncbi:MAG TPA: pyridoxine 5'-phosphate synthase, partial [Burkholderiaceae bacterium]|nr:pyridoxine 5'-phosphate synthase [Burkholderiaceae bacterium]
LGLGVNIGHDLNLHNLPAFMAGLPPVDEASIGHALTADALELGYVPAVKAYIRALQPAQA